LKTVIFTVNVELLIFILKRYYFSFNLLCKKGYAKIAYLL